MPTPISTSDPILAAVAASPGVTTAFLADVVDLIDRSPNLLAQINQLDATPLAGGGTAQIELQSGGNNGGNTFYHSQVINIGTLPSFDDSTLPYYGGSLAAGQTEYLTPAGTFVGVLAHEIAHWGDAQLGPLYATGSDAGYTIEQAVATEFASEGKAAFSQYVAMSQIQGTETAQPVRPGVANGNILFDVTGAPIQDTALLQHVQSSGQATSAATAADISYLGSQFWNVPVDSGTYLTTMWGGYGASGAKDDLGIAESQITQFQISEAAGGALAGCTIQTRSAAAGALTYQIACPTPGAQQARILDGTTGTLLAMVSTTIPSAGAPTQITVSADRFSFAVIDGGVASVQGDDDSLALGRNDSLFLAGTGAIVSGAAGNTVSLEAASSASVDGGGTINLVGDTASVRVSGVGSAIRAFGQGDAVAASGGTVTLAQAVAASLTGSYDAIAVAAQDVLSLTGTADSVSGSLAGLVLSTPSGSDATSLDITGNQDTLRLSGGSDSVRVFGDHDRVFGGAAATDLRLSLSGTGSMVSLTAGHASITGGSAGTTVFGGASDVAYGSGGGILVMGSGAATVAGAGAGASETVFGGASGLLYQGGQEYADVIGGAGPCTIHAGSGGGWISGGAAGANSLAASGAGTVLDAGGNGDTLVGASGGGTFLIASAGNETLYGGNRTGESTFFLAGGDDAVVAGPGGSVIDTGAGAASVYGGGGHDQVWAGSGDGDLFVAGRSGQLEIHGFRVGTDHLVTAGQEVVAAAQVGGSGSGGTMLTLSSGATIMLAGVDNTAVSLLT